MKSVRLKRVSLGAVRLYRVALTQRKGEREPWLDVANILTEDGGFMLTEDGGALLMESGVKQIRLRPRVAESSR